MIRQLGGQVDGQALVCGCAVVGTYRNKVAVGQLVSWSTSSNLSINSAAVGAGLETLGRVVALDSARATATVQWLGYNRLIEAPYSGAISRGNYVVNATAGGAKVRASGSASGSVAKAVVVAVDAPLSGTCLVAVR